MMRRSFKKNEQYFLVILSKNIINLTNKIVCEEQIILHHSK